jgi:bifunctional non-homologous end joining protein LigD
MPFDMMVPVAPEMAWNPAHEFTRGVASRLAAIDPDRYVTSAELAKRPGKLFIDYLRNRRYRASRPIVSRAVV